MPRLFFGISPDSHIRSEIVKSLYPLSTLGALTPEANLHITLQFMGEIDSAKDSTKIDSLIAEISALGAGMKGF